METPADAELYRLLDEMEDRARSEASLIEATRRIREKLAERLEGVDPRREELQRSESKYRLLFENMSEGFALHEMIIDGQGRTVDFRFVNVNRSWERHTGLKGEDVVGRTVRETILAMEPDWIQARAKVIRSGEPLRFVRYFPRLGKWYEGVAFKHSDNSFATLLTDITDRKRSEQALQESEEKLRLFVQHAPAALAMFDRQMRYVKVSRRWLRDNGMEGRDLRGVYHYELFPETSEEWREIHRRALAGEVIRAEEEQVVRPDGTVRWRRWEVRPWEDAAGFIAGIMVYAEDITPRMQAEVALRESEKLLRKVLETLPVGVLILNQQGKLLLGNQAAQQIWGGASPDGFQQLRQYQGWWYDSGKQMDPEEWAGVRALGTGETTLNEEIVIESGDGSRKIILDSAVPIRNERGEISGAITVIQDVTDRKRAEEELLKANDELEIRVQERTQELRLALHDLEAQTEERIHAVEELRNKEQMLMQQNRFAAMGEMIGNIAHQWRQPLNMLGLLIQQLDYSYETGDFSPEYLHKSSEEAMEVILHMSRTIDDFRNFFRKDEGKLSFKLNTVVATTVSFLAASFKTQSIVVHVEQQEEISVQGYPNEFSHVVLNILLNAKDAFQERNIDSPEITIRIYMEQGRPAIAITDNAGGIPDEVLPRIFEPYFTTKGPEKGTGIGLFMSKTIIEKNMGGLLVARNIAEGAEFMIVL
jgi:PAS domain S-box-containing protein